MKTPELHSQSNVVRAGVDDTADLPASRPTLAIDCFGLSDTGQVRPNNEDQFLVATLVKSLQIQQTSLPSPKSRHSSDRSYLFIVADGMGGAAGGEEASALAIDSVETYVLETLKWFSHCRGADEDKVLTDFRRALSLAHGKVRVEAEERPDLRGMGTTLTLAYSLNDELYLAHVGDSRCYLLREKILYRLTEDHTLVEEMIRRGTLSAEEAVKHRWRHVITSTVGGESSEIRIDVHRLYLEAGDVVLVCTDGLTEMVTEEEIASTLHSATSPQEGCQQLVAQANAAGGKDNITVVVAKYTLAPE